MDVAFNEMEHVGVLHKTYVTLHDYTSLAANTETYFKTMLGSKGFCTRPTVFTLLLFIKQWIYSLVGI